MACSFVENLPGRCFGFPIGPGPGPGPCPGPWAGPTGTDGGSSGGRAIAASGGSPVVMGKTSSSTHNENMVVSRVPCKRKIAASYII